MPKEVLEALSLGELADAAGPKAPTGPGKVAKRGGSGYLMDSVVKSRIEWRAVDLAWEAYEQLDYKVEYTGASKPYDLVVVKGADLRRVEVKGSSGAAINVELTSGEVDNSRGPTPTDLFVVDGIDWWRLADGSVQADGGEVRWWRTWSAGDKSLTPIRYRYKLPSGGNHGKPKG